MSDPQQPPYPPPSSPAPSSQQPYAQQPSYAQPYPQPHLQHGYGQPAWPYGAPLLRVPSDLAVATIVVASVFTVMQLAITAASFPAAGVYRRAAREDASGSVFTLYDALTVLTWPTLVAAYVVSCLWLHRCRANVETFAPHLHQERGKVWVWLGWWVPVVQFWFPRQVVRDVQVPDRPGQRQIDLGWWWFGWVVFLLATWLRQRLMGSDGTVTDMAASVLPIVETVAAAALLLALAHWIAIVRRTTDGQRRLAAR